MPLSKGYLFVTSFIKLLLIYCVGLLIFLISRIYFLVEYGNFPELSENKLDVFKSFTMGFRTDTMSICYGLLPPFLLILAVCCVPGNMLSGYQKFVRKSLAIYCTILYGLFLVILISDFFFFRFFNDHLNILVFGIFHDDTKAVLTSIWTDYPVLRVVLLVIFSVVGLNFLLNKIVQWQFPLFNVNTLMFSSTSILSIIIMFTGLRNSWGTFPLRIQNTIVSENTFINKIGIGGVYSLQNAFKEQSESTINTNIEATLKKYRFTSVEEAVAAYTDSTRGDHQYPFDKLLAVTPKNERLELNKPHVVVIQMESMSNNLLDFHSKSFNLLGDLEHALTDAYVFRNFVSATSTTINSLEALLIASPETPISQSIYYDRSLSTSSALPYVNAGYETSFITGAELAWRNLDGYLSNLYFHNIVGNVSLKKANALAHDSEWGTYDEFMFDRIFETLENSTVPQFIYGMTISNHTPFSVPETYKPYPLELPEDVEEMLKLEKESALENFLTYQYANDCLGKFIQRVRGSKLKDNTIIVAVGDHSIQQLFNLPENKLLNRISIPLIIILPTDYRPAYKVDLSRFGSHKDVFPTLFNVSLSGAKYVKSGNNLLSSPSDSSDFYGVYKYDVGFSKDGCVRISDNLSFSWSDSSFSTLKSPDNFERLKFLNLKVRAYSAVMSCFIKNELQNKKPN